MAGRTTLSGRSEISTLVASALVLLVGLSTFTLLAYRSAVTLLLEERHRTATEWAAFLLPQLTEGSLPSANELARQLPGEASVSIYDPRGRPLVTSSPVTLDLDPKITGAVTGSAYFARGGQRFRIRVDVPARVLRSRERSLAILTPVVLGVDAAVLILVMLYVRRILAPIDLFFDRARRIRGGDGGDDVEFLVRAFEKALETLTDPALALSEADEDAMPALERALAESLESGVLLCDGEGRLLALNPVASTVLEVDGIEVGAPAKEVLGNFPGLLALIDRAVSEQATIRREECQIRTSRGQRTLGLTAHPLRRAGGEVRGHLFLFADLTEVNRRLAEDRLSESLKHLGELSAGVAHEMRNGLATLKGYLTLIDRARSQDAAQEYLQEIRAETDHLHRVLEDFLAFARPGSTRLEALNLGALVHRVAQDPALGKERVAVEIDLPQGSTAEIAGDRALLARAVTNLLRNAVAAQGETGSQAQIDLRLSFLPATDSNQRPDDEHEGGREGVGSPQEGASEEDHDCYVVTIGDRGPGLPEGSAEQLFEPFVTGREDGVGLGLALARRIVLLHQGRLQLTNRNGGGALAEIRLPVGTNVTDGNNSS